MTQVGLGVPVLLLTAIFPLMSLARSDEDELSRHMISKVFRVAAICGAWMSIATVIGASFIIKAIAGSTAHGAIAVLQIQAAVFTLTFLSTSSALALISLRRYRVMLVASLSALALDVLLGVLLIPGLGARGGAIADVITESLVAVGLLTIVVKETRGLQITARFVLSLLFASGLSLAVLALPTGSVARVAIATPTYFAVLVVTGSIPEELLNAVRSVSAKARAMPGVRNLAS